MKDNKRGQRLKKLFFIKRKRLKQELQKGLTLKTWSDEELTSYIGKRANTSRLCSCFMCMNSYRKVFGNRFEDKSVQEKSFELLLLTELKDE